MSSATAMEFMGEGWTLQRLESGWDLFAARALVVPCSQRSFGTYGSRSYRKTGESVACSLRD